VHRLSLARCTFRTLPTHTHFGTPLGFEATCAPGRSILLHIPRAARPPTHAHLGTTFEFEAKYSLGRTGSLHMLQQHVRGSACSGAPDASM